MPHIGTDEKLGRRGGLPALCDVDSRTGVRALLGVRSGDEEDEDVHHLEYDEEGVGARLYAGHPCVWWVESSCRAPGLGVDGRLLLLVDIEGEKFVLILDFGKNLRMSSVWRYPYGSYRTTHLRVMSPRIDVLRCIVFGERNHRIESILRRHDRPFLTIQLVCHVFPNYEDTSDGFRCARRCDTR